MSDETELDLIDADGDTPAKPATKRAALSNLANRLYRGEAGLDVVGKRKIWYSVAAAILLIAILSLTFKGLALGVEFKGGNTFELPPAAGSLERASDAIKNAGAEVIHTQKLGTNSFRVQTAPLGADEALEVKQKAATALGIPVENISDNAVSASWGSQITNQALKGLALFLVA